MLTRRGGENPSWEGGNLPPSEKATLAFISLLVAGCWVDSKKNFLFFPIDIRRRSRTTRRRRRRRRRYLFDPPFETRKRLIFC